MKDLIKKADEFGKEVTVTTVEENKSRMDQARELLDDQVEFFNEILEELQNRGQATKEKVEELSRDFWDGICDAMYKLIGSVTALWDKFVQMFKPEEVKLLEYK